MRQARVLLTAVLWIACVQIQAGEWVLHFDPEATDVGFSVETTLHDVHGMLSMTAGEVRFDQQTGAASGRITIDARRADTANRKRDKKMHAKVLESEQYPVFEFIPSRVEGQVADSGTSEVTLHGTLTIHGDPHPIALPAKVEVSDGHLEATTTFPVPYVEWGMQNPSLLFLRVAKVVEVTVAAKGMLSEIHRRAEASPGN